MIRLFGNLLGIGLLQISVAFPALGQFEANGPSQTSPSCGLADPSTGVFTEAALALLLAEHPGVRLSLGVPQHCEVAQGDDSRHEDGRVRLSNESQPPLPSLTWLNSNRKQERTTHVSLRTREGYYLRAKLGGGGNVVADVRHPKTSEVFAIEWLDTDSIRLRTRDGFYVGARMGGGQNIDAETRTPGSSEVFRVEWQNEEHTELRLRTREGYYVHPVRGGGDNVDARKLNPNTSETLTLIDVSEI